jgi:exosortase
MDVEEDCQVKSSPSSRSEPARHGRSLAGWAVAALLGALVVATYAPALAGLLGRWQSDPDYVHGFLVPLFSGFLLWHRRAMLPGVEFRGSLWGLPLLAIAAAMRMASSYYYYDLLDPASLIPCLAGLTLFVGGWQALGWAWPSIAFLVFMVPLPGFVAVQLGQPLQRVATVAGTFVIQTVGIPAVAEGNVILLSDSRIGVAEACNGLRNMMLFLAVCVAMSFVIRRTTIEKVIIVLSAAGIALIANLVRIAATAILHEVASHEAAKTLYHDLAGWFMMPLAVVLLWLELAYLRRVFVAEKVADA